MDKYISIFVIWLLVSATIIYFEQNRWHEYDFISECHKASVKYYHEKPMCTTCKLFCDIKKVKK